MKSRTGGPPPQKSILSSVDGGRLANHKWFAGGGGVGSEAEARRTLVQGERNTEDLEQGCCRISVRKVVARSGWTTAH
jgi:hypothetical protein